MPLSSPEVQQTIGGSTVHEIACHYGFQSRNHFARDYRNQFGESLAPRFNGRPLRG